MVTKHTPVSPVTHKSYVIGVGYALFALMVLGLITDTVIPLSHLFWSPHVRLGNVTVFMVALIVGSLVPSIVAYLVGDASTRSKDRRLHHYNGVLFGVLAYWADMALGVLGPNIMSNVYSVFPGIVGTALGFAVPVVIVALAVGILAYFYHRGRGRQVGLVGYRPYQVTLFVTLATLLIGTPLQQMISGSSSGALSSWLATAVMVGAILISFVVLMRIRIDTWHKATLSVIGVTLGVVALYMVSQFANDIYSAIHDLRSEPAAVLLLVGLLVWILYLYITRLSYRK